MAERTEISQFLKERRLTRAFNTWKSIKSVRKKRIEVAFSNYDGTVRRSKIYVYRKGNYTYFRDFKTLKVIGKSKKSSKNAINAVLKRDYRSYRLSGWNVVDKTRSTSLKLKNITDNYSYNTSRMLLRKRQRKNTYNKKGMGMLGSYITVIKGKRSFSKRVRSRYDMIGNKSVRERLLEDNIRLVAGFAGFSPESVIIHEIWYEYWSDEYVKLKKVK